MSSSLPLMAGCLVKSPPGLNGSVTTQSDLVCNTPQDCSPPRILPNSPVVTLFAKQPTNFVVASFSVHGVDDKTWPRKWESRFFELIKSDTDGAQLRYYETEAKDKLKATISLSEYRTIVKNIKSANPKRSHVFCLVSDARKLFLNAESAAEADEWVQNLVVASPHLASGPQARHSRWVEADETTLAMPPSSPGPDTSEGPADSFSPRTDSTSSHTSRKGSAASGGRERSRGSNSSLLSSIKDPSWTRRDEKPATEESVYYDCNLNRVPASGSTPAREPTYVEHNPASPPVVFEGTYVTQSPTQPIQAGSPASAGADGPERNSSVSSHISLYSAVNPPPPAGGRGRSVSNTSQVSVSPTYMNQDTVNRTTSISQPPADSRGPKPPQPPPEEEELYISVQ